MVHPRMKDNAKNTPNEHPSQKVSGYAMELDDENFSKLPPLDHPKKTLYNKKKSGDQPLLPQNLQYLMFP